MGTKERRAREREGVRQRIMEAARELFVTQGYEHVSMRKIAEATEYSAAAVYLHFKDKEDLLQEMCRCDFGRLNEVAAHLASIPEPLERIRQLGLTYVKYGLANPHHYRLMFMTAKPTHATEEELEAKKDPSTNAYAMLKHAVKEAIGAGVMRPEHRDVDLAAQLFWAGVHGVTSLQITMHGDPFVNLVDGERSAEAMVELLIRGMTLDGAAGKAKVIKKGRR